MHAKNVLPFLCAIAAGVPAQEPASKIHPYLEARLAAADPGERLPVYFVLRSSLGYDHWFPRVQRMDLAARRADVIGELRAQAQESQAGLLDHLGEAVLRGAAEGVHSNWLGNFVTVRATAEVILAGATRSDVEEVWYDYTPPLDQIEDRDPAPAAASPPFPSFPNPGPIGNGPLAVDADKAWTLGFRGEGVLVMNADSGINVQQGDLVNRLWINSGEIPGNNVDDDGNMLVDDVHGWNYETWTGDLDDGGGHGTQVAGCIVGDGSCSGTVFGIAPESRLMSCRISNETEQWYAVQYALVMGADVMNSSHSYKLWFDPPPNYKMHRMIGEISLAAGLIRINSTSNDGSECDLGTVASRPTNVAAPGNLPPPYLDPNQTLKGKLGGVLGVGAWNQVTESLLPISPCGPFAWNLADILVRRPDYSPGSWDPVNHDDYPWEGGNQQGLLKPDLVGPTDITTTAGVGLVCDTAVLPGTSSSSPVAAGCIALWKGANPSLTPEDVAMIVHQTSRDGGVVPGKENDWGAGIIDALAGLKRALCVNRVDGQSAWELEHRVGEQIELKLDGVPSTMGAIAVGFERRTVDFGPIQVGIGSTVFTAWLGLIDAGGNGGITLPVSPAALGLTIYTQAFVDDLRGATGEILTSNVIGVEITP